MEKEKTKLSRTWKGKFFSSTWAFLFCFWGNVLFTSYVLATTVLFVPVGKRSNSRSQMFCKIDALKNLAIFTGKHLVWRFFLINFIKKRHQYRCFSVNVATCLSTAFYIEHIPFIILFRNFMWWKNSLDVLGYRIDIFHISCAIALLFMILVLEPKVHCYFVYILLLYRDFH